MASLSAADQKLDQKAQSIITEAKNEWAAANSAYQSATTEAERAAAKDQMTAANNKANQARSDYGGYTAGTSGTDYIPNSPNTNTTGGTSNAGLASGGGNFSGSSKLSYTDQQLLNPDQQQQILALKDQYAAAKAAGANSTELQYINDLANKVRANAGYTAGKDGTDYVVLSYNNGGKSADEIKAEYDAFLQKYYSPRSGWTNGYSVDMNTRSKANRVRQQMLANEKAMENADKATRDYLHAENVALADMLGGTTKWNDDLKRWETANPNVGYGYDMNGTQENIRNAWKNYYGYTDDQINNWAKDTSHYYNFVDVRAPARNTIDESSGFTGRYAQFVNGPYASLLSPGAHSNTNNPWEDSIGDGFGDEGTFMSTPQYDENGNIIKTAPALKNNNDMSLYTQQFKPVTVNGLLAGQGAPLNSKGADAYEREKYGDNNIAGQRAYYENYGQYADKGYSAGAGSGGFEGYLQQLYDSALQSQLAQLETSYNQNVSDLNANVSKVNDTYTEQKRQTTGTNAQEAAAWREMANAIGLNTGAIGQAALAQNNQLQSNLNTLESAEASALTEIERQRVLLGQQYQLQINQAISENNFQKAQALYQEAVRAEQQLMQQQQFASQMALQYAQLAQNQYQYENDLALQYAKAGLTMGGDTGSQLILNPSPEVAPTTDVQKANYNALVDRVSRIPGLTNQQQFNMFAAAWENGDISDLQYATLLNKTGLDQNMILGV